MERRFRLFEHAKRRCLWTREAGRELRHKLEQLLDASSEGDVVVLDMSDIEAFDYSFANEFFAKLLLSVPREYPGRFLVVDRLTEYTHENLDNALSSLNLIIINRSGKKTTLLGKVHAADQATFEAVIRSRAPVSAASLKDQLDVGVTAMNERLSKLASLGLVRRQKSTSPSGREQFIYRALS